MHWAEDLTRSEDAARWSCGIFLDFPCLSLLYSNCFCNFSINSIAVLILLGCVDFAWLFRAVFISKMPTVTKSPNGNILGFGSPAKTCGDGSRNWKRHFASSFASPHWSDNFNKKRQILALPPLMAPPLDLP